MRSLLSPAPAAEPVAPPVTAPAPSVAHVQPSPDPPGPAQSALQVQLYSATERLALALVQRAERDLLKDPEAGKDGATVRELQTAVTFAMDLLVKLPKLKPEDPNKEDAGVDVLRQAMADPAAIVERLIANPKFIAALKAKGWLPPPPRPSHRPTKEQQLERIEYEAREREVEAPPEDDSELRRMLSKEQK